MLIVGFEDYDGPARRLAAALRTDYVLAQIHRTLVAPYLCYLRQDTEFEPGDAVSAQTVGKLLVAWFDEIITVDPHLHRIEHLADALTANSAPERKGGA